MSSKNAIGQLAIFFLFILGLCIFAETATAQTPPVKQTELETRVIDLNYCVKFNYEKLKYIFNDLPTLSSSMAHYDNARDCREKIKQIDFSKYTLLGVDIYNQECTRFPLTHKVIRDEAAELYRFQVTHPPVTTPCRGITHHELWVLVPKMPEGYKVAFEVGEDPNILRTRWVDMKGCVQMFRRDRMVIRDNESFLKAIRNDASRKQCLKDLDKTIDFARFTLLGIDINSGYCRMPAGLEYKTVKDDAKKLYTLQVSYIGPHGVCRALSSYDLWVLVPKMPEGYEAAFEVKAVDGERDN